MSDIRPTVWVAATRPAFLSVTLVGVLLGLSTAQYNGAFYSLWLAAVTLIFAVIAHAGANVLNDYYDALSGCDAANVDRIFPFTGGSRFIQNGLLSTKQTAIFGYALLISVIPAGLYLVFQSGPGLLIIGLCGLLAGWAYSATPCKLQSRGVGELTITVAWTMIIIGSDYVQRGSFALTPLIAGFAYALLVANVLFINQVPDHLADAITGKNTLIVRWGVKITLWGSCAFYIGTTAITLWAIGLHYLPSLSFISVAALIPASLAVHKLYSEKSSRESLQLAIPLTIVSCLLFGLLLSTSLIL